MKKKILSVALLLALVTASVGPLSVYSSELPTVSAASAASDNSNGFQIENGVLVSYDGKGGDVVIPNTVTSIGDNAFYYCTDLTNVTIPNSVKSIGEFAFYNCTGLTSVTIPNSVTKIGRAAFNNCDGLERVTLPNSITSLEETFRYCTKLTDITIPSSVTAIGDGTFGNCTSLTDIQIPNSVTSIGDYAFYECVGLKSITIPSSVKSIGYNAFEGCIGLTSVTIPSSVTVISDGTFAGCQNLTEVKLPDKITSIGSGAFSGCGKLTSVNLPNSVTSIGNDAFRSCKALTGINIPKSVTSIGQRAFQSCSSLTAVTIPNSVTSIGEDAFYGCTSLTSVTVPNAIVSISEGTFENCSKLTNVTIPNSVVSIGARAFKDCRAITSLKIPDSVKFIREGAFDGCTGLTSVTLSNAMKSVSDGLFDGCFNLKSVKLPNAVTSIGYASFGDCRNLASIQMPNTVTSIGDFAFSGCSNLINLALPDSIQSIGSYAFEGCTGLTSITIPKSVKTVAAGTFFNCPSITRVTIPKSVKSIGDRALASYGYDDVFYAGSEKEWKKIQIGSYNAGLTNAKMHYNGETLPEIIITSHPISVENQIGASAIFTIKATGEGLTYQWQLSDDAGKTWRNSSVKTANYSTTLSEKNDGRYVRCIISDKYGSKLTTKSASMKINTLAITAQPVSVTVKNGAAASFRVKATGLNLSYQWQLSDDEGKTWRNSSVKTANYSATVTDKNNGRYVRCIVTDKNGNSVTSDAASMKATTLKITTQPKNAAVFKGEIAYFKVAATGDGVKYQWQLSDDQGKTWRNSKATSPNYSAAVTDANNGRYVRCIITDKYGSKLTSYAAIMKITKLQITAQPLSVAVEKGETASFKVKATGSGLTYQWQLSDDQGKTWRNSKAIGANYAAAVTDTNNGRYVRCIVSDKFGNKLTSDAASMSITQ